MVRTGTVWTKHSTVSICTVSICLNVFVPIAASVSDCGTSRRVLSLINLSFFLEFRILIHLITDPDPYPAFFSLNTDPDRIGFDDQNVKKVYT